jgi:hypothetical protein
MLPWPGRSDLSEEKAMPVEVMSPISRRGGKPGSIHRADQAELQEQPEVHVRPETHVHMEAPEQPEPEPGGDQAEPEEPRAAADTGVSSGQDLSCGDPRFMQQFEELFGRRVFGPNVPGSALGVTGPD